MPFAPPADESFTRGIYDPKRDRFLYFEDSAGSGNHRSIWSLSLHGDPAWSLLTTAGIGPDARTGATVVYDPIGDRVLIFAGRVSDSTLMNDLWELSLASETPTWRLVPYSGQAPPERSDHAAVFDPEGDRMLVFGGFDGRRPLGDTWEIALRPSATWREIQTTNPPSPRMGSTATYDPAGHRAIIIGGVGAGGEYLQDVTALSLAGSVSWATLPPAGPLPPPRAFHTAVLDSLRGRLIIYGGWNGGVLGDVWALQVGSSAAWSRLVPTGDAGNRFGHVALPDPTRDQMVVTFGAPSARGSSDVAVLKLEGNGAWLEPTLAPPHRAGAVGIYDPIRDRLLVLGGNQDTTCCFSDVWAYSFADPKGWSQVSVLAGPDSPVPRTEASVIYDPVRDRLVLFGGLRWTSTALPDTLLDDVWALGLSAGSEWTRLPTLGPGPRPRKRHNAVYDPEKDRMIVFGGDVRGAVNDVWAFSLNGASPTWVELQPQPDPLGGTPNVSTGGVAAYDSRRHRMVIWGGWSGVYTLGAFALTLGDSPSWTNLNVSGTPFGRDLASAAYDSVGDRMVLFGGFDFRHGGSLNEAWELPFAENASWRLLAPRGPGPSPRNSMASSFDPVRSRFVMFGGATNGRPLGDGWMLDLSANSAPTTVLISAPAESAIVGSDTFHFSWQGSDDQTPAGGLSYAYRLDADGWAPFTSDPSVTLHGVAEGWHRFQVRARDADGNLEDPGPRRDFASQAPPRFVVADVGGEVSSLSRQAVLVIPPHALTHDTRVTVKRALVSPRDPLADGAIPAGPAHEVLLDGAGLQHPATLRISETADLPSYGSGVGAAIYTAPLERETWTRVGGTPDPDGSITVPILSEGRYAIFRGGIPLASRPRLTGLDILPRAFSPGGHSSAREASIIFSVTSPLSASVRVYNRAGRLVRVVAENRRFEPGEAVVRWDGLDSRGAITSDGLYLVVVQGGDHRLTKPVAVVR